VDREVLTLAVRKALDLNRESRAREATIAEVQGRLSLLTPRERQVLPLLVAGHLNKQVAAMLGISEVTVQIHRGRIMHKMLAASFADLIRACALIGIPDAAQMATQRPK
jgi:FixJ family two-component response regulator